MMTMNVESIPFFRGAYHRHRFGVNGLNGDISLDLRFCPWFSHLDSGFGFLMRDPDSYLSCLLDVTPSCHGYQH